MILKILVFIVTMLFVYFIFFKKKAVSRSQKNDKKIEDVLIECSTCNIFVSRNDMIMSNGKYFCSEECIR